MNRALKLFDAPPEAGGHRPLVVDTAGKTPILDQLAEIGISAERTILLGFSQGVCLALEHAARHARRYGGLVGLSGDLIGPDGTPRDYPGSTPRYTCFSGMK
jgi:phospholipase/carboxylesterase